MATKRSETESVGSVLSQSLKRLDLGTRLDEYGVWPIWNEVVGKTVANNAQPEKIRNGTLFIKVSSPVWMQQLQYMKEMIAEKLNQRLGGLLVKNIFFVVGKIQPIDEEPATEPAPAPEDAAPPRAVDTAFLQTINDPDIRRSFERLLKGFARRKLKE